MQLRSESLFCLGTKTLSVVLQVFEQHSLIHPNDPCIARGRIGRCAKGLDRKDRCTQQQEVDQRLACQRTQPADDAMPRVSQGRYQMGEEYARSTVTAGTPGGICLPKNRAS